MQQQFSIDTDRPIIHIKASGDLRVCGWEQKSIAVRADHGRFNPTGQQANLYDLSVNGDCELNAPTGAEIFVYRTGGDLRIESLVTLVTIDHVGGDAELVNLAACKIEHIGGDLILRKTTGDLIVSRVGGDLIGQELNGYLDAYGVGGDIKVDGVKGIRAAAGGDAQCRLDEMDARGCDIKSGGSLSLAIPSGAQMNLKIDARGGMILVDIPGWITTATSRHLESARIDGAVEINLRAGRSVSMTTTGAHPNLDGTAPGAAFAQASDFKGDIHRTIDEAVNRTDFSWRLRGDILDRKNRYARSTEEKIRDAVEKVDNNIQAALNRIDQAAGIIRDAAVQPKTVSSIENNPPVEIKTNPAPINAEPVTDDERMLILQMVENKKISVDEAEALLEALEQQADQS
jgi:hypothetical protein